MDFVEMKLMVDRPMERHLIPEVNQKDESIVQTYDKSILVTNLKVPETQNGDSRQRIRRFAVDYCYDPKYPESCTQESVYQDVGKEILDSMFDGYNACVLAYGHSASGKTYTMMGEEDDPGLTPRICRGLFRRMGEKALTARVRFHTVISFLEIYNERVRDLLVSDESAAAATAGSNFSLRVREHPKLGPYVQDLSQHVVNDEERILEYLAVGNSRRSTAATENNVHSSRSHAVFTIRFKQTDELSCDSELTSKVHLVDLAGSLQETSPARVKKSERAGSTQSKTRLKEGANINKSLVTLGNVISALAESCETFINPREQPATTKTWQPFVPYRDSVLTWLLKDTLGGNSNTIMIATISPASSCLNETINTLRYAKRTKRIVNQPIVNEDPKIRTIKELREEIEKLRSVILSLQINNRPCLGEDTSPLKCGKEEGEAAERAGSKEAAESPASGAYQGDEGDAIRGLDIVPDLGAGGEGGRCEGPGGGHRVVGKGGSASGDVSEIDDEKGAAVNGSVIDKLIRESQVFPGNLASFSVSRTNAEDRGEVVANGGVESARNFLGSGDLKPRKRRVYPCRGHKDNQSVPRISRTSKLGICSRRHARPRLKLYLRRECNSLEALPTKSHPKMLHRSRPDLIKGISSRSKDGLPSTSSQSFTDVSGLSQSASENSLNSSGSVESQAFDGKEKGKAPEERKAEERKMCSRQSSLGDGSGSSTPTQVAKTVPKRRADKRSEIVAAVTTRLYATKKKPDPRMEALQAAAEKDEDDDGELEELKLCKRARMKLFDLSRKLAMAKKIKKTMDSDTQTDFFSGTVRVKEKCVVTDQSGVVQYENCGTNTPVDRALKKEKEHPIIMNQVFIPRFSEYVVECGKSVRVEVPAARPAGRDSGTQTVDSYQTSLPQPSEEHFSDDSLEDDGVSKCRKDFEVDSLEVPAVKPGVKSQSNENVTAARESVGFNPRRSYDSLLDSKTDRSWLPITRYPIAGTNALYEYDPNKSAPEVVYRNAGEGPREGKPSEEVSGSKIRKTEIVLPLFNGLPLAICTETVSSSENVAEDAINFVRSSLSRFAPMQSEENGSSDNSFASNEGSDVTSSSETSSEDFVFYEGPREKETLSRQSGLGNLYTISENSELSDLTASDPSSPQTSQHPSLQVLEPKRERKAFPNGELFLGHKEVDVHAGKALNKDYTVGVHILRNPLLSDLELQERLSKSNCNLQDYNHNKYPPDGFVTCHESGKPEDEYRGYYPGHDSKKGEDVPHDPRQSPGKDSESSHPENPTIAVTSPPETSHKDGDGDASGKQDKPQQKKRSHPNEKQTKKINWSDVQSQSHRQFLNFNILGPSKQTPFTIDSNMFGEKKQSSEAKFPSEDSITFVFMGPNRQKTSMLMEIIKRTLGQSSCSEGSLSEKSHRKSRSRGVQCKLMRSVSVDTAMIALSRFAKHQRPVADIPRTSSLDTLVPEEMQMILEQGRLHGMRESGCQCDLGKENPSECQCRRSSAVKYAICTSTTRDQGTETEKFLETTDKSSMTLSLVDASCDALSDENLFDDYFPPLPRRKLSAAACREGWKDMKDVILGTSGFADDEEDKPKRARKAKKSVSWSDLSECAESVEGKSDQSELYATPGEEKSNCGRSSQSPPVDYVSQTRRVRFTEPQQSCLDGMCHMLNENAEATQTAVNVTAFLKEAVLLLKNLNHLSQIYDLGEEPWQRKSGVKSSLKKVETSVQTDGQPGPRTKEVSLSAESSPIRRARTSSALADRRERKASLNLTWPRQRPTALGKPPTGLKSSSVLKTSRSPLPFRPHSSQSTSSPSFDVLKNDIESSSTSTNWNISNLSTAFSNSYVGDSVGSRPSSSKSYYSDGIRGEKFTDGSSRHWTRSHPKIHSPRLPRLNLDLEMDLEDSCRRLELAVERDRIREENSSIKLSSLNARRRTPTNWYFTPFEMGDRLTGSDTEMEDTRTKKSGKEGGEANFKHTASYHFGAGKPLERKINAHVRRKPCKCYCHYRNTRVYRSSLELEAHPPIERHCHACCTPCDAAEPERSNSAPALNSICDSEDNKCRLFYYGYCPCSPVKLPHVKSSPRAYMQHLLSLRRQIVKKTYDSVNGT